MKKEIVLTGAVRTAIGKFGGSLTNVPTPELGAIAIREALHRAGIAPEMVDEVFMGSVLQAGLGQNVARQAAVKAGIPDAIPATTINNVCGSGLRVVNLAAALIEAGEADIIVVGGMENMSAAPYLLQQGRYGYKMGSSTIYDSMINDALECAFNHYHMGITAENVAKQYHITREMQDQFAASSQQKCEAARKAGIFDDEIVPVEIKSRKETILFNQDEFPRNGTTVESLSALRPAFEKEGTVTAGNASGINDGAAAIIVMSAQKAKELNVKPMARWVTGASAGVDPAIMGIGPVESTRKALAKANLTIDQIDLIEANEAFAAQALAVGQELGWNAEKVNVYGGAIALGHPVGASGTRILVTLLHAMQRRQDHIGLATLCVGGGMGVTAIVERM